MAKKFLLKFNVNTGSSDLPFYFIDEGASKSKVEEIHEVIHDECGLDQDNTPIGGAEGECYTEVVEIQEIMSEADYEIINKYFCIG